MPLTCERVLLPYFYKTCDRRSINGLFTILPKLLQILGREKKSETLRALSRNQREGVQQFLRGTDFPQLLDRRHDNGLTRTACTHPLQAGNTANVFRVQP